MAVWLLTAGAGRCETRRGRCEVMGAGGDARLHRGAGKPSRWCREFPPGPRPRLVRGVGARKLAMEDVIIIIIIPPPLKRYRLRCEPPCPGGRRVAAGQG